MSAMGVLEELMIEKMSYKYGESDMIAMVHFFGVRLNEKKRNFKAELIDFGELGGYSAMARAVGFTLAFAADAVLKNKIDLRGVHVPVSENVYELVLPELEKIGLRLNEKEIHD